MVITLIIITIPITLKNVHRCGVDGSMHSYHAAGPGLIPGWDKFLGEVFWGFSSPVRQRSPNIIWPS